MQPSVPVPGRYHRFRRGHFVRVRHRHVRQRSNREQLPPSRRLCLVVSRIRGDIFYTGSEVAVFTAFLQPGCFGASVLSALRYERRHVRGSRIQHVQCGRE